MFDIQDAPFDFLMLSWLSGEIGNIALITIFSKHKSRLIVVGTQYI
jgi:hypothetical protein